MNRKEYFKKQQKKKDKQINFRNFLIKTIQENPNIVQELEEQNSKLEKILPELEIECQKFKKTLDTLGQKRKDPKYKDQIDEIFKNLKRGVRL